jgi:hypothetical protein
MEDVASYVKTVDGICHVYVDGKLLHGWGMSEKEAMECVDNYNSEKCRESRKRMVELTLDLLKN